ncbi:MAG: tetratricopeptide repeat protein, partial [Verrucomicrobiota bacterium]|nr:tetratricopeptide repeat protein [Verrucomicrobiota bacterium]
MSSASELDLQLEIAHVLLIDVVGYSKLLVKGQIDVLQQLNEIVRGTQQFRSAEAAGQLTRLPTGDGMALMFFDNPETPVLCAIEIARAASANPTLALRMGLHSGPIKEVKDVNDRSNFAGAGINIAQRVLDCGDAGHILLSERIAEDLRSYDRWNPYLHDIGRCVVKHGVELRLFNLWKDGAGNATMPDKVSAQQQATARDGKRGWKHLTRGKKLAVAAAALALVSAAVLLVAWRSERAAAVAPLSAPEKSIAVLPFGNLSDDPANAYFAEGVQDEILTDLAKVEDLKVISRTSVRQYRADAKRNMREIGAALGVAHVLEGSVQRVGNRVRVHAQLIDARTDQHIWANRYDRDLADVFAMQTEVAEEIVAQLKSKLSPVQKAAMEQPPTKDWTAYESYIRAKGLIEGAVASARGIDDLTNAATLLSSAIARDPDFFLAYYQLAHAQDQLLRRADPTPARRAAAEAAIKQLQRLRPDAGETHLAIAKHLYWGDFDVDRARAELALAQAQLPNDPTPSLLAGYIDRRQGKWEDSIRQLQRALELDPQNPYDLQQLALTYQKQRRFRDVITLLDRAVSLAPQNRTIRAQRAAAELEWRGDTAPLQRVIDGALASGANEDIAPIADSWFYLALCQRDAKAAGEALQVTGSEACHDEADPFPASWCEGVIARTAGDAAGAATAFTEARRAAEQLSAQEPGSPNVISVLAMIDAGLGNHDAAIRGGRAAMELLPVSKDAIDGAVFAMNMAVIYAWTGETDLALEQLKAVAAIPSNVSYGNLRLHPYWDPLRGDPRFDAIV